MKYYIYNGEVYTGRELAAAIGMNYSTLMSRLSRGYTIEEAIKSEQRIPQSIIEFCLASHPPDWSGLMNEELYDIYNKWCVRNDFKPESHVHFTRCLKKHMPNVRIVPSRIKRYGEILYKRIIRVD